MVDFGIVAFIIAIIVVVIVDFDRLNWKIHKISKKGFMMLGGKLIATAIELGTISYGWSIFNCAWNGIDTFCSISGLKYLVLTISIICILGGIAGYIYSISVKIQ